MPACVFARRQGHIALSSGTGIGHRAHAQGPCTGHSGGRTAALDQHGGIIITSGTASVSLVSSVSAERKHQRRHQLEHRHGSRGDFKRPLSELNTYAIIMQSFRRFSVQLRCVSSKMIILFIILIFYRRSIINALRPVCCEMNVVLLK